MRIVDLGSIVVAAADSVREPIARKKISFKVSPDSVHVAGDPARLQQIVSNLLTNAIQFTPDAGEITCRSWRKATSAVLSVHDTGAGIEPAFLPHVFDQFRQGEGGLSRKHGGLGLGLAVVQQLVDLHGGSASVESEGIGLGATFIIRLPRETALTHHVNPADDQPLLSDLRVQVAAPAGVDCSGLIATLESSGASVLPNPTTSAEAPEREADVVVTPEAKSNRLTLRLPPLVANDATQVVPADAAPGEVVRRIARFVADSKVS